MSQVALLKTLREARERQYDNEQAAKRKRIGIAKMLFWILMSPMIVTIIAALWGMHDIAAHAVHHDARFAAI